MSANFKPLNQSLFNTGATPIIPPILTPQAGDETEQLLAKMLSVGGGGSGSYTASTIYFDKQTGVGSTPSDLTNISIYNQGAGLAYFNGVSIPSGFNFSFNAAPGTKFSPVSYNGSGSNLFLGGARLI